VSVQNVGDALGFPVAGMPVGRLPGREVVRPIPPRAIGLVQGCDHT